MFTPRKRNLYAILVATEYALLFAIKVIPFELESCILVFILWLLAAINLFNVFDLQKKSMGIIGLGQHSIETIKQRTRVYRAIIFIHTTLFPFVFIARALKEIV